MTINCYGICTPMCACWQDGECKFHFNKADVEETERSK